MVNTCNCPHLGDLEAIDQMIADTVPHMNAAFAMLITGFSGVTD